MNAIKRIASLLFKQIRQEISGKELRELNAWRNTNAKNHRLYLELTDPENILSWVKEQDHNKQMTWNVLMKKMAAGVTHRFEAMEEDNAFRLATLIAGYQQNQLSAQESEELDQWVDASDENMVLYEMLTEEFSLQEMDGSTKDGQIHFQSFPFLAHLKQKAWIYAAAACLIGISLGLVFLYPQSPAKSALPITISTKTSEDLGPGTNRAQLILDDGSSMLLDSMVPGKIALPNNVKLEKTSDAILLYEKSAGTGKGQKGFNTIKTPRGGQFRIELSDGTLVWLNAASSLRYPVIFDREQRNVELSGEAYFEVAKDPAKPFRVIIQRMDIQVMGTHFNVNAYADEVSSTTTLLEGSIRLAKSTKGSTESGLLLKPGESAISGEEIRITKGIDTNAAVAWKKGWFDFKATPLKSILRQLSRWYDVDLVYENDITDRTFTGRLSRNSNASIVLQMLEYAGVHFRIEHKRIIVMK